MTEIESNNIYSGFEKILKYLYLNGEIIIDERKTITKEIRNLCTIINDPLQDYYNLKLLNNNLDYDNYIKKYILKHKNWKDEKLLKYCKQFLSSKNEGFVYTYGNRLRAHFDEVDQIDEAIKRLNNCRESRRAISITWDPKIDVLEDDVPCLQYIQFQIRNNNLEVSALWRSHDIYGAWFPNVIGLSYLSNYVAEQLNINIKKFHIYSMNAHIYKTDFDSINKLLFN